MGEIRTVHDARLGRTLAIKLPVGRDPETTRQFVAEATLTARLGHPGIVAVHDAGRWADGRPFYTMPIVQGRSLAVAIAESSPRERLRLVRHFLDACEAIAYAHSQGVLHRDLKPSNILVGRFGETIVVDWGVAGPIGASSGAGTPDYMAPEQASGEPLDARADVYALGVTLREILTGAAHASGRDGSERDGLAARGTPPELLAIIERATREDPSQRYADGRALAEDVAAWFEGRRVAAHRYSITELMARVWAVHRLALSIALLALISVALASAVGYRRTAAERAHALESEQAALAAQARAEANLAQAEVAQALVAMAKDAWPQAELFAAGALMHGPSLAARGVLARFDRSARPRLLARTSLPRCARSALSSRGDRLACREGDAITILDLEGQLEPLRYALEAYPIALFDADRLIASLPGVGLGLIDLAQPDRHRPLHDFAAAPHSHFVGEHGRLAWITGEAEAWTDVDPGLGLHVDFTKWCSAIGHSMPGVVGVLANGSRLMICQDGGVLASKPNGDDVHELLRLDPSLGAPILLGLSTGSRYAAIGLAGGKVVVLDLDEARVVRTISGVVASPMALALTESRVAVSDGRESVYVWELASGALVVRLRAEAQHLRWLDEGRRLRLVGERREDWSLPTAPTRPHLHETGSGITALSISPDGLEVLSAHGDGQVRLTPLDGQAQSVAIPLHWSVVKDVEFSPAGDQALAICAQSSELYVIDRATPLQASTRPASPGTRVAWLRASAEQPQALVLSPYGGGLRSWPPSRVRAGVDPPIGRVYDMESDPDRGALTFLADHWVARLDTEGRVERIAERSDAIAVAGCEEFVVVASLAKLERIDAEGGSRSVALTGSALLEVALSPDTRKIALGHLDGSVSVWSSDTLEPLAILPGHVSRVVALAFDPRGEWLVSGSWDGDIRQWSMLALELEPARLLAEAEAAWGLTREELLAAGQASPDPM